MLSARLSDNLQVVGMEKPEVGLQCFPEGLLGHTEDAVDLVGPAHFVRVEVVLPVAHVSDTLRLGKACLAPAQGLLRPVTLAEKRGPGILLFRKYLVASSFEKPGGDARKQRRQTRLQRDGLIDREVL